MIKPFDKNIILCRFGFVVDKIHPTNTIPNDNILQRQPLRIFFFFGVPFPFFPVAENQEKKGALRKTKNSFWGRVESPTPTKYQIFPKLPPKKGVYTCEGTPFNKWGNLAETPPNKNFTPFSQREEKPQRAPKGKISRFFKPKRCEKGSLGERAFSLLLRGGSLWGSFPTPFYYKPNISARGGEKNPWGPTHSAWGGDTPLLFLHQKQ